MVDEAKIDSLVKAAVFAELDGVEFIQDFDYAALCSGYNGIGPEWMPAALREKVSAYLELFAPAALIHDMRYQVSDGSRVNFNYANLEFFGNCVKLANDAYPWYSWRRYRARLAAQVAYDFVRSQCGWVAWCSASAIHLRQGYGGQVATADKEAARSLELRAKSLELGEENHLEKLKAESSKLKADH